MPEPALNNVSRASLPVSQLPALAELRLLPGLEIVIETDTAWLHWQGLTGQVLEHILPIQGVQLYSKIDGQWFPLNSRLPVSAPATQPALALSELLQPTLDSATLAQVDSPNRVEITLVVSAEPQKVTATLCRLPALKSFAETAPLAHLKQLQVAQAQGIVLLIGQRVPLLEGAERFWGEQVLCPVGFKPTFNLPDEILLNAAGVSSSELLIVRHKRTEIIPRSAFATLTRASARLSSA
ncbi:MAG: hypothetical protein L3J82_04300 [Planctomycetes bacterium]|nr:hypothetical protein [Planctomycetota bacterium]